MKKLFKVVLIIVAVVLLIIAGVFYLTAGLTETADSFFEAVASENLNGAREFLAEDFKKSTSESALKTFLSKSALADYQSASWSSRSISGGRGNLEGSVETKTGGVVPLSLSFVKEQGTWKIFSIKKPPAGIQQAESFEDIPPQAEQTALIKDSMTRLAKAINSQDFVSLHSWMSSPWQSQYGPEKLQEIFKPFVEQSIDLSPLDQLEPILTEAPKINKNGFLVLRGNYPSKPSHVTFTFKYIYEHLNWRLVGLSVNVG